MSGNFFKIFNFFILISFILITGLVKVFYPSEIVWDLLNYHYYNPWAFFHNRLGYDIAPALINTYFNPLIDVPYYLMLKYWSEMPFLIHFCQGAYYGILLFIFYHICLLFFDLKKEWLAVLVSVLIAATGYASLSQAGTSSNEVQVSILILWGFYLIVKHISDEKRQKTIWIYSGLLMGCALGLKPTVITYCVALGATLIVFKKPLEISVKEIAIFALSGLLGYLIINGWWMWQLYEHFDSPFFPFLNKIFKSEYFENFNYRDEDYVSKITWLQKLYAPFIISFFSLTNKNFSEIYFFDLRFFLVYVVFILMFFKWIIFNRSVTERKKVLLYSFVAVSYFIWLYLFSIMRYVIPIEMLSAIIIVKFFQKSDAEGVIKKSIIISFKVILIYALLSEAPYYLLSWKLGYNFDKIMFIKPFKLAPDTIVKTYGCPSSMFAALLVGDQSNQIMNYANGYWGTNKDFIEKKKLSEDRQQIESQHKDSVIAIISHNNFSLSYYFYQEHLVENRVKLLKKEGLFCKTFKYIDTIDICVSEQYKDQLLQMEKVYEAEKK